ncbi:sulfatase [Hyaloraphidium curvatum]|nr:sulfatase [Hyaloraphidium curvatum]
MANPGGYNILFILTDQERHFRSDEVARSAAGEPFVLPSHERLAASGVVFENHRINSCVCTSSRSVIYTGQHIQKTGLFDNVNFPWSRSLSTDMKTVGHLMRSAGVYSAYKGKWHMSKEFEEENTLEAPHHFFTKEMDEYGFSDYYGIGDVIARTQGGYLHDGITAAMAANWLRGKGTELAAEKKPWFLAVNMVNPHDVMFYDTDEPGKPVQAEGALADLHSDPPHALYQNKWDFDLPKSFSQPIDSPGRPHAHFEFAVTDAVLTGRIPADQEWRWKKRHNFYLNALLDVDRNIVAVLDELRDTGLDSNTIVILTSDHGELDGAHQLSGKGATAYREQNNVPLIISHPGLPHLAGKRCRAVTSHLDLVPTMISLSSAPSEVKADILASLPGKDLSSILSSGKPEEAAVDSLRPDGQLYCFNMFLTIDGNFLTKARNMLVAPGGAEKLKEAGLRPDLRKRGAIRSVFDGRYTFARYYSPKQHNLPQTLDELFELNDVELFDTVADPDEKENLALDRVGNARILMEMNAKLNRLIAAEVGEDVGQMLPGGIDGGWVATKVVNDL